MTKKLHLPIVLLLVFASIAGAQTKQTLLYAERDTCSLYLDLYMPSSAELLAENKPVVMFAFGGGFYEGKRDSGYYIPWFNSLVAAGYPVVSIDYRLGLKGVKYGMNGKFIKLLENAINLAVEDMFGATAYLLSNASSLGLEGRGIVVSGSSAGAITSLEAEYYIANSHPLATVLPEGFNYSGVMAFAGAIFSRNGSIKYAKEPCPQLLFHGDIDKMVPYKQIQFMNLCFGGTSHIARSLKREDRNYQVWRFKNHYHEISISMEHNFDREISFLERNVSGGEKLVIDSVVDDPSIPIPSWAATTSKEAYK